MAHEMMHAWLRLKDTLIFHLMLKKGSTKFLLICSWTLRSWLVLAALILLHFLHLHLLLHHQRKAKGPGSRSNLVQSEGREPTAMEMFEMTHKTKGSGESSGSGTGQSVTSRDEKFVDDYQREMIKKHGPNTDTHPLGDIEVWEHCAGGRKRGRMFGVGTCGDPSYVVIGSSSGWSIDRSYVGSSSSEVQELNEKLQKIEEERAVEREEEKIRMSNRLKNIVAMLARQYPPPPSGDPTSRDPLSSGRI